MIESTNEKVLSNAYNLSNPLNSGIDPRTGLYYLSLNLGRFIGNSLKSTPVDLTITYSLLSTVNIGFGFGWSLKLSHYDKSMNRINIKGESYYVENHFIDKGTLKLRYQKLKKMKVMKEADGSYIIYHKEGYREYLNKSGHLYKTRDPNGTYLFYEQVVENKMAKLVSITDEEGSNLRIRYASTSTVVELPGGINVVLQLSGGRLNRVAFPEEHSYRFQYKNTSTGHLVIEQLIHPNGLKEKIGYRDGELGAKLPGGGSIPVVDSRTTSGPLISTVLERFRLLGRNNYLGYKAGTLFKKNIDNLYEREYGYEYQTSIESNGRTTINTYDKWHCLLSEVEFDNENGFEIKKRMMEYDSTSDSIENQPPTFQLPKKTLTFYNGSGTPSEIIEQDFDEFANQIREIKNEGIEVITSYYQNKGQEGGSFSCPYLPKQRTYNPFSREHGEHSGSIFYEYEWIEANDSTSNKPSLFPLEHRTTYELGGEVQKIDIMAYFKEKGEHLGRLASIESMINETINTKTFTYQIRNEHLVTIEIERNSGIDDNGFLEILTDLVSGHTTKEKYPHYSNSYLYDSFGRLIKKSTAENSRYHQETQYQYCINLLETRVIKSRKVDGQSIECEQGIVDAFGRVVAHYKGENENALLLFSRFKYNQLGQLESYDEIDDFDGINTLTTYYKYDLQGNRNLTMTPDGVKEYQHIDYANFTETKWLSDINGSESPKVVYRYSQQKNVVQISVEGLSSLEIEYDGLNRPIESVNELSQSKVVEYDALGRKLMVTDYCDGESRVIEYTYDKKSTSEWLTSIQIQGAAKEWSREFDSLGRVVSEELFDNPHRYKFKSRYHTNPSEIIEPNNTVTTLKIDSVLDEVVSSITSGSNLIKERKDFEFDNQGRLIKGLNESDINSFEYDWNSNLIKESGETGCSATTYSRQGRPLIVIYHTGESESYKYNALGQLSQIERSQHSVNYTYDSFGRIENETIDAHNMDVVSHRYNYDSHHRLVTKTTLLSNIHHLTQSYEYRSDNKLSNVILLEESGRANIEEYDYTPLGQLAKVTYKGHGTRRPKFRGGPVSSQIYSYDISGNVSEIMTEFYRNGALRHNVRIHAYNQHCQLISVINSSPYNTETIINYDTNGNLLSDDEGRQYLYNAMNQLSEIKDKEGNTLCQYRYDSLSRLIQQNLPNQEHIKSMYIGNRRVADQQGDKLTQFFNGISGPLVVEVNENGERFFSGLVTDIKNSVLTSVGHNLLAYSYLPFGEKTVHRIV